MMHLSDNFWRPIHFKRTEDCSICLGTHKSDKFVFHVNRKIKHIFHRFCIKDWIVQSGKDECPLCNQQIHYTQLFLSKWDFCADSLISLNQTSSLGRAVLSASGGAVTGIITLSSDRISNAPFNTDDRASQVVIIVMVATLSLFLTTMLETDSLGSAGTIIHGGIIASPCSFIFSIGIFTEELFIEGVLLSMVISCFALKTSQLADSFIECTAIKFRELADE